MKAGRKPRAKAVVLSLDDAELFLLDQAVKRLAASLPTGAHVSVHSFAKDATLSYARQLLARKRR